MAMIEMSVSDWVDVVDNPRQRNTERRANFAIRNHLRTYCKIHAFVYAATIGGEIACKLDGHTRSLLWDKGLLDLPPSGKVCVILVDVASLAEAKAVHDQLDCSRATKKPCDIVFGATREHKFQLSSALLRSCSFLTQLKVAETGGKGYSGDPNRLVKKWKPQLVMLDSLGLTSNYTVLIALMLIAIKRDGAEEAGPFFVALDKDEGGKASGKKDGVEALHSHMERRRAQGTTAGWDNLRDMLCRGWNAYEAWRDDKQVKMLSGSDKKLVSAIESYNKEVTSCP